MIDLLNFIVLGDKKYKFHIETPPSPARGRVGQAEREWVFTFGNNLNHKHLKVHFHNRQTYEILSRTRSY